MSRTIIAFSKYLVYGLGGAEHSLLTLLSRLVEEEGAFVRLIACKAPRQFSSAALTATQTKAWKISYVEPLVNLSSFPYLEYVLNRRSVMKLFASERASQELFTYAMWAPPAILAFAGESTYFIRSETDIGIDANYYSGWKKWLRKLYWLVQLPFYLIYLRDLRLAMKKCSCIVANSEYMRIRTRQVLGIEPHRVEYPLVDKKKLQHSFAEAQVSLEDRGRYILFIGDNERKGLDKVVLIAGLVPEHEFLVVSRMVPELVRKGNILWSPWGHNPGHLYAMAKLVIVPSQWEEAFGRVAKEADILGIPVLVSGVGGLPESVSSGEDIVEDYARPETWAVRIRQRLTQGNSRKKAEQLANQ